MIDITTTFASWEMLLSTTVQPSLLVIVKLPYDGGVRGYAASQGVFFEDICSLRVNAGRISN